MLELIIEIYRDIFGELMRLLARPGASAITRAKGELATVRGLIAKGRNREARHRLQRLVATCRDNGVRNDAEKLLDQL